MHVAYFSPLSSVTSATIMNYLPIKTRMLILLSSKITLYNFSNPFIWKSSLWYKILLCPVTKNTPKYEQGVGVERVSLDLLPVSIPSETTTKKTQHGKKVWSFFYQYVLRNRMNTDLLKIIYTFYSNLITEESLLAIPRTHCLL